MRIPIASFSVSFLLAASLAASDLPTSNTVVASGGSQSRVAVRGDRLVVAFLDATGAPAIAVSQDSGKTFGPPLPVPIPDPLGTPDVAFTPGGDLLVACGSNSQTGSPLLVRSADGGNHFSEAYAAYHAIVGTDPHLAVDAGVSSPRAGSIYLSTWDYPFDYYGSLDVGTSSDSGRTFRDRSAVTYDAAAAMAVAENGDLYVASRNWDGKSMRTYLVRSPDGGKSLAVSGQAALVSVVPPNAGPLALAVDGRGVVHLAFAATPSDSKGDQSDVFYTRSTDLGMTFSPPVRLNDDDGQAGQTSPRIAVAPDGIGTIAVSWRDRRNDPTDDSATDVYMSLSKDGGLTFGPNRRVSGQTWLEDRSANGNWFTPDGALVADPASFHAAWTDTARGVLHARLPLAEPPDAPDFGVSVTPYAAVLAGRTLQLDVSTWSVHGFAGDLRLAVEAASGSPSASLQATTVSAGDRTLLTLAPDPATAPGVHRLTLAASSGAATRRADVIVNVFDPSREATVPTNVSSSRGDASAGYSVGSRPGFSASGALYVPYVDNSSSPGGYKAFVRRSPDAGHTFSEAVPLLVDSSSTITTCPSGVLYALRSYSDQVTPFTLFRSTDGGATFRAVYTPSAASLQSATFACAPDGSAAFVWSSAAFDVVATIARDGVIFGSPVKVEAAMTHVTSLRAAWDAQSRLLYILAGRIDPKGPSSGYQVTLGRLFVADRDQPFRLLHEFAAADSTAGAIPSAWMDSLAVDTAGTVHVGWESTSYVNYRYGSIVAMASSSQDGGATFRDIPLSASGRFASTVSVTPAGSGEAIAIWALDGKIWCARSLDSGRTYAAAANLSASPGATSSPSAAADPSGNVFVIWTDTSRGHQQVFGALIPSLAAPPSAPAAVIELPSTDVGIDVGTAVAFRGYGTGALLLAPHWDFGDGTSADSEAASHAYGAPGTFIATFTVTDPAGRSASASRRMTVRAPQPTAGDSELILPVVADTEGLNASRFTTDVTLVSRAAVRVTALLEYTAGDGRGSGIASVLLEPGQERTLPDVLGFLRERGLAIPPGGAVGSLRIVFRGARPGEAWAFARTSTPCGAGRCGVAYGAARASVLAYSVVGLQENVAFRSNLAFVNLGDEAITLRVTLLGSSGETLRILPDQVVSPLGWVQLDRPLLGLAAAGRAVVTRVAGASTFFAYGILNDQTTSDGSLLPPVTEALSSDRDRLLPVVLDATGLAGSRYLTELTFANLTDAPMTLTFLFRTTSAGSGSVSVGLAAGQQVMEPDAISFLRRNGLAIPDGNAAGSLLVSANAPASGFAALARTYTAAPAGGTYGVSYPGLLPSESAVDRTWVYGLEEDSSARSNVAVVNRGDAGDSITLELSFFDSSGTSLGAPTSVTLAPGEWKQLGRPLAALGAASGYVRIDRSAGASRFVAYGVRNDASNSDGSILPMNVAP